MTPRELQTYEKLRDMQEWHYDFTDNLTYMWLHPGDDVWLGAGHRFRKGLRALSYPTPEGRYPVMDMRRVRWFCEYGEVPDGFFGPADMFRPYSYELDNIVHLKPKMKSVAPVTNREMDIFWYQAAFDLYKYDPVVGRIYSGQRSDPRYKGFKKNGKLYVAIKYPKDVQKNLWVTRAPDCRIKWSIKHVPVHKIVWFMHCGRVPTGIFHIDGNPLNNRIENLGEPV